MEVVASESYGTLGSVYACMYNCVYVHDSWWRTFPALRLIYPTSPFTRPTSILNIFLFFCLGRGVGGVGMAIGGKCWRVRVMALRGVYMHVCTVVCMCVTRGGELSPHSASLIPLHPSLVPLPY